MPVYVWIALAVFVLAAGGGVALAAVRGLTAWRTYRRFNRRLFDGLAETTRALAATETKAAAAGRSAQRLDRARADLQLSLTTARVLAEGAGEAKALVDRLRGVVPRR